MNKLFKTEKQKEIFELAISSFCKSQAKNIDIIEILNWLRDIQHNEEFITDIRKIFETRFN